MFYTEGLNTPKTPGDYGDIIGRSEQIKANQIPNQSLNFLMNALGNKTKEIDRQLNMDNVRNRWFSIYHRYGLVQLPSGGLNVGATNTQSNPEDMFEY